MSFLKLLAVLLLIGAIIALFAVDNTKVSILLIIFGSLLNLLDYYRKGTLFK